MSIKSTFSIKDLENLSGVKAHTIRIWEKRYNLLAPVRTDTNIRTYDIDNLQKLLSIAVLNKQGLKVSKIAKFDESELLEKVKEISTDAPNDAHSINTFKIAMLNFDEQLFHQTYSRLIVNYTFREIFTNVFLPLLKEIGVLWITKTIIPAHEHFISILIQQKLLIHIEQVQNSDNQKKKVFVLFLPDNEIHELGLLYIHFEMLLKGYKSIYLGQSIPMDNLIELQKVFKDITFISYFTVAPAVDGVNHYLQEVSTNVLSPKNEQLHVLGRNTNHLNSNELPEHIFLHKNISDLIEYIN